MSTIEELLSRIRSAQTERLTPDTVRVEGEPSLRFLLKVRACRNETEWQEVLTRELGLQYQITKLFAAVNEIDAKPTELERFYVLTIPSTDFSELAYSPYELSNHLKTRLDLESIEPDHETEFYNPFESEALDCWEETELQPKDRAWALRNARVPEAWAYSSFRLRPVQGVGVTIAQPDTGVNRHDDLDEDALILKRSANFVERGKLPKDPLISQSELDNPGHGIATASVVISRGGVCEPEAGRESGTTGPGVVTGVAPQAKLAPIRAVRSVVLLNASGVAQAIDHARRQRCDVITMSLGGLHSEAVGAAIDEAVQSNIIVLAAAGNCVRAVVWPARLDSCIAVAGTNIHDRPWKGSSRGRSVQISAPGEFVWRAMRQSIEENTKDAGGGQGTSFAVAIAAGIAALWLAHHGRSKLIDNLPQGETLQSLFVQLLQRTARQPPGWDAANYGPGIIDAGKLLAEEPVFFQRPPKHDLERLPVEMEQTNVDRVRELALDLLLPSSKEIIEELDRLDDEVLEEAAVELMWLLFKKKVQYLDPKRFNLLEGEGVVPALRLSSNLEETLKSTQSSALLKLLTD